MKYRYCNSCGAKKPLTEDYYDPVRKNSRFLRHMCKECASKYGGYFDCPSWEETPRMKMVKKCRTFMQGLNTRTYTGLSPQVVVGMNVYELSDYLLKTYADRYDCEWDGKYAVDIDHIIPISSRHGDDIIPLWHYENLQLLRTEDHRKKSNRRE